MENLSRVPGDGGRSPGCFNAMKTSEVDLVAKLLRDFEFVDPTWQEGIAFAPFWGRDVFFSIYPEEDRISCRQLLTLSSMLKQTTDIRSEFEQESNKGSGLF